MVGWSEMPVASRRLEDQPVCNSSEFRIQSWAKLCFRTSVRSGRIVLKRWFYVNTCCATRSWSLDYVEPAAGVEPATF